MDTKTIMQELGLVEGALTGHESLSAQGPRKARWQGTAGPRTGNGPAASYRHARKGLTK
jgi:hypothetical protein